jgi:hypothetical protein
MKRTLFTILLAAIVTHVLAADSSPGIRMEAQKCANALLTNNFEGVLAYTHKRVVAGIGGKEAMLLTLKRGTEQMRAQGISFTRVEIGDPQKPKKVGDWLVALVPQKVVMKVPDGYLDQESYLLGISEDEGKKWAFVDVGPISQEQLTKAFPEFDGHITLPEKKKPVFHKNE